MKIYLDPGHGGSDPGAMGNGLNEKGIVLDIALHIRTLLINTYENIEVRMSRTGDITKSLAQRTSEANSWGADYYLSIHCNSSNSSAQGYEDYIHNSLPDSSTTAKYQDVIHGEIVKVNQLHNRGRKKANFHVLRETNMPALLTENGFIDNKQDAALMKDSVWRRKVAQGHVDGLARAFNLETKLNKPVIIYKVIAGAFKSKENAEDRKDMLRSKGIESLIMTMNISGVTWYRIQVGSFSKRENAEDRVEEIKRAGINDTYIVTGEGDPNQKELSEYPILGGTYLSPLLMEQYVKTINSDAIALGMYYLNFGEYYGIRGDIAFAQAIHETDFFRFTGVVQPEQHNFCGLGTTGPDNPGASFDTPRDGVIAHFQHLFAYASAKPLPDKYPLIDPRFNLVQRETATTWVALNGKWAVPGDNYGQSILNIYKRMVNDTIKSLGEILQEIKD
ncbi:N-acetylmuramoyl-L-alanine amidase [Priestia filamentosa]|uniref:N-acetylmuramoyl-L-alanine amidase n=1 Tax=Priestia filamentosa TaxID=1402861 RepID=UPI000A08F9A9|nr:N-acetylmuramoyl-L-alanine amidase [Priestia filamentosa]OXS64104.1 N-acetylmuramoyl-L-alanine amidase [Priestia filamentosa]SMF75996.1 N-acetylmuramoyl-L-alanine amidase [Priestia filamentosa]